MTSPEAVDRDEPTLSTSTAAELRAILTNTPDADLRSLARAELRRRPAESHYRDADPSTAREVVLEPAPRPMTRAEIGAARRFGVVLYDGRRLS